jgi:hypothetical protein
VAFERVRFNEYYGLKKETFSIDPARDSIAYFGSGRLSRRILGRIESDFAQARGVPKFYVLGDYGAGKTHTLFHIAHELRANVLEPVEPVYIDIAPMRHKEKFATLQGRLLDAIGLETIAEAAEQFVSTIPGDKASGIRDRLTFGDAALISSQSSVFRNILFGGKQRQLSWEWLKGTSLSGSERETLQVTKMLSQPGDFVSVLLNTAVLYRGGKGKKLVYLMDEAEAMRDVQDPDSVAEFIFAFRQLLDDSNNVLGVIAAIQPEGREIGEFFSEPSIMRRIGYDTGVFDLTSLVSEPIDIQKFIEDLLAYLIDEEKARQWCDLESLNCDPRKFPFETEALQTLETGIQSDINLQRPAGIIQALATAAIDGWRLRTSSEHHITVNAQMMEEVLYPGR